MMSSGIVAAYDGGCPAGPSARSQASRRATRLHSRMHLVFSSSWCAEAMTRQPKPRIDRGDKPKSAERARERVIRLRKTCRPRATVCDAPRPPWSTTRHAATDVGWVCLRARAQSRPSAPPPARRCPHRPAHPAPDRTRHQRFVISRQGTSDRECRNTERQAGP